MSRQVAPKSGQQHVRRWHAEDIKRGMRKLAQMHAELAGRPASIGAAPMRPVGAACQVRDIGRRLSKPARAFRCDCGHPDQRGVP